MGLKITTDEKGLMVWRNDEGQFPSYSYTVARKNEQGEWENCYRPLRFKRGVEIQNKTLIAINTAFESFNVGKDGKKYPYLMVTDFNVIQEPEAQIDVPMDIPDTDEEVAPFK